MSYLAIQAGLAGWNIWASQRYKDSLAIDVENLPISEQIAHTDKLHQERGQAMTSLISFWSAVGIGIAEALIIGLIEEPQSPNSQD